MTHEPGTGLEYDDRIRSDANAGHRFSRALRQGPLNYARSGPQARWYIRRPDDPARPHQLSPSNAPGRSRLELPAQLEPIEAWREIRAELAEPWAIRPTRSGSERSRSKALHGGVLLL